MRRFNLYINLFNVNGCFESRDRGSEPITRNFIPTYKLTMTIRSGVKKETALSTRFRKPLIIQPLIILPGRIGSITIILY